MAAKPKQKRKPKLTDKEQSERFKAMARELGTDETGAAFERVASALIKPKRAHSSGSE